MLATNSGHSRRGRFAGTPTTNTSGGSPGTYLARPRLPLRCCFRPRLPASLSNFTEPTATLTRMKRLKNRKVNAVQKMDLNKKKSSDYTEMAYREAVSKLKYLLAETYAPRTVSGRLQFVNTVYQTSNPRIESGEDTDDRSLISDCSRTKNIGNVHSYGNTFLPASNNMHPSKACSNLALSATELQSVPPELTSFIERQEEYIEQLERESQYCRDELTNLLSKVREVVAENEALHNENKNGFLKCALEEHKSTKDDYECNKKKSLPERHNFDTTKSKPSKILEGPSIMFESRISELEAQLTQAKLELRKAQEENQLNLKRLSERCLSDDGGAMKVQLEQALRAKYEAELKSEEAQKALAAARDKEAEAVQKAKRSAEALQQTEFEKNQCETEARRLKDELDRQHEKLREATQDTSRRIAEERQQVERRYSQQVEQLSADIASQWDVASKSHLESEKQRRELVDLRRELAQKQTFIDNLKKELQSKMSSLQSELNQALTEKDASEQEVLSAKLAAERSERHARQEQNRLQAEINSYKQRLERADADLVHCRRENLRLLEQIASLEKEISMSKIAHVESGRTQATPRLDNEKELTSMLMDMETKHAATVAGLEDALSNQATLVSQLTAECQSLTQRLEANNLRHKEEMANLQSNIEYLSSKIQGTLDNQKENPEVELSNRSSVEYNYDNAMSEPDSQLHNTNLQVHHNQINIPQLPSEEYNDTSHNHNQADEGHEEVRLNTFEQNNSGLAEYEVDHKENAPAKEEMESTKEFTQEYEGHDQDENASERYPLNSKNLDTYTADQEYNQQYEEYDPSQYEAQKYPDSSQYSIKESENEATLQ